MFDEKYIADSTKSILFGWFIFIVFVILGSFLGGYFVFLGFLILTIRYLALPIYIPHNFKLDPSFIITYFHSLLHRHSFYGWSKFVINTLIISAGFLALFVTGFLASTILLIYETIYLFHIKKINNSNYDKKE